MTVRFNWGLGISLVYVAFAAGTLTMVAIASQTRVDLVTQDYYARSLAVDDQIAAVANGRASGATIAVDRPTGEPARLVVTWGPDVQSAQGTLTLYRPSGSAADRVVPVAVAPGGAAIVPMADVPAGRWQAQLRWTSGGRDFYVEHDIVVP